MQEISDEQSFITYPTWKKYLVLSSVVETLKVKDKRAIFYVMRRTELLSPDTFFPLYGFTAGDFAVWQILCDAKKRPPS